MAANRADRLAQTKFVDGYMLSCGIYCVFISCDVGAVDFVELLRCHWVTDTNTFPQRDKPTGEVALTLQLKLTGNSGYAYAPSSRVYTQRASNS